MSSSAVRVLKQEAGFSAELRRIANVVAETSLDEYSIEDILTDDLVEAYRETNPLAQQFKKLREAVRDVLADRREKEGVKDAKGNFLLCGTDGDVEFRARVKLTFLPDVAKELLDERGLLELASRSETVITDSVALTEKFEAVQELLVQMGQAELAQEMETVYRASTEKRVTVVEDKIEALVKKGRVSLEEAKKMYGSNTSYAIHEV